MEHEKYFTSQQNRLGQKLNIEDLLIAPVQRLPKYQLLIKVSYSSNENKIAVTDTWISNSLPAALSAASKVDY